VKVVRKYFLCSAMGLIILRRICAFLVYLNVHITNNGALVRLYLKNLVAKLVGWWKS